jgi:WD40 repeat protein
MFFFGPETEKPKPEIVEEATQSAPSPDSTTTDPRKHPRDNIPNGLPEPPSHQPSKRSRKTAGGSERNVNTAVKPSIVNAQSPALDVDMTNGHTGSITDARSPSATDAGLEETAPAINGVGNEDRMDVDDESTVDQPLYEALVEAVPPPTLSTGASIGIQVAPAKITDLSPSTTILQLQQESVETNRHVTNISWRPGDSNVMQSTGDSFARVWNLARASSNTDAQRRFHDLVTPSESKIVTAVAWEPNGEMLALATYSGQSGQVLIFEGSELALLETLPASQRAITSLRWHGQGSRLLGIAPYDNDAATIADGDGSSILLWDLSNSESPEPLSVSVPEVLVDMDCVSSNDNGMVCAAGQQSVYLCRAFSDLKVEERWNSDSDVGDQWTFVRCNWHGTDALLVVASADSGSLWMPAKGISKREAHTAPITGIELRPRGSNSMSSYGKNEFATSSVDGTIRVWKYDEQLNSIISICKLIIGFASPIMTLSYSPDGFCLAGASYDTLRIWNAEHSHNHMATWKGNQEEWSGSQYKDDDNVSIGGMSGMNGEGPQGNTDHSLAWDSESKKLAFGLGRQVRSIMNCYEHNH